MNSDFKKVLVSITFHYFLLGDICCDLFQDYYLEIEKRKFFSQSIITTYAYSASIYTYTQIYTYINLMLYQPSM